jgi:hypothetical protein
VRPQFAYSILQGRTTSASASTEIIAINPALIANSFIQGGSVFPNLVEKTLANYYITGDERYFNALPPNFGLPMSYAMMDTETGLGYRSSRPGLPPDVASVAGVAVMTGRDRGHDDIPLDAERMGYTAQDPRDAVKSGDVPPEPLEEHHVFPVGRPSRTLEGFFKALGIVPDDYTVTVPRSANPRGGVDVRAWKAWLAEHPNATSVDIYKQAGWSYMNLEWMGTMLWALTA